MAAVWVQRDDLPLLEGEPLGVERGERRRRRQAMVEQQLDVRDRAGRDDRGDVALGESIAGFF